MKIAKRIIAATLIVGSLATTVAFAGCSVNYNTEANTITISDIYEEYKKQYGEDITFEEFLKEYLSVETDSTEVVQNCLKSSVSVYCEFSTTQTITDIFGRPVGTQNVPSLQIGSGIIYKMDEDYTYIITNYHVVYGENTHDISKISHIYLYGSESAPYAASSGATSYSYDSYAIPCDYVGGSIDHDVAVLKAETNDIYAINDNVRAVDIADGYAVGQTAIAIGNPGGEGISATKGMVSVENEYITLAIDGTSRSYRSLRIDTAIYEGSSGGGLFDMYGRLIGLTNAGDGDEQNVNFAIPVQIVTGVADNIIENNSSTVKKITLGITVQSSNSRNEYDPVTGNSAIKEDVIVSTVNDGSIAKTMGVKSGDVLKGIVINGEKHAINRNFELGDLLLTVREGDEIKLVISRGDEESETSAYTVQASDLS